MHLVEKEYLLLIQVAALYSGPACTPCAHISRSREKRLSASQCPIRRKVQPRLYYPSRRATPRRSLARSTQALELTIQPFRGSFFDPKSTTASMGRDRRGTGRLQPARWCRVVPEFITPVPVRAYTELSPETSQPDKIR